MSDNKYKEQMYEAVEALLWQQWAALGVAAHAEKDSAAYVLDPEALLLISSAFCRYNQRLYDLVAQWLEQYSRLVNPTRLKALLQKATYCDVASLSYWAAICLNSGDARWKLIAARGLPPGNTRQALFIDAMGGSAPYCREHDALALHYGLMRNPYQSARKVLCRLPQTTATLLMRLRSVLGSTARAEIMLLLMEGPADLQQLADRSGFARSSIKAIIDELMLGQTISGIKTGGKSVAYILPEKHTYCKALGVDSFAFPRWSAIYEAIGALWQMLQYPKWASLSAATKQGEYEHLLQSRIRPLLLLGGIPELMAAADASITDFAHGIAKTMKTLQN